MSAVYRGRSGTFRLVVEQAGSDWEWIVWPAGDSSRGQSGLADTQDQATRAAEAAVRRIDGDVV
jgi:adenylylsulfate kinase-like enzyme